MSTYWMVTLVDEPVDQAFTTGKNTNLEAIRIRLIKVGDPLGKIKMQILNAAKTQVLAQSEELLCNFSDEASYDGTDAIMNMSWIRFKFTGEALRTSTTYVARVLTDSSYGPELEESLSSWVSSGAFFKTACSSPVAVFRGESGLAQVSSLIEVDDDTKYYYDGDMYLFSRPVDGEIYLYKTSTNYLNVVVDYPQPTSGPDGDPRDIITTQKRNFQRYPRIVLQLFGKDFG